MEVAGLSHGSARVSVPCVMLLTFRPGVLRSEPHRPCHYTITDHSSRAFRKLSQNRLTPNSARHLALRSSTASRLRFPRYSASSIGPQLTRVTSDPVVRMPCRHRTGSPRPTAMSELRRQSPFDLRANHHCTAYEQAISYSDPALPSLHEMTDLSVN